jgi:hypothetical protein
MFFLCPLRQPGARNTWRLSLVRGSVVEDGLYNMVGERLVLGSAETTAAAHDMLPSAVWGWRNSLSAMVYWAESANKRTRCRSRRSSFRRPPKASQNIVWGWWARKKCMNLRGYLAIPEKPMELIFSTRNRYGVSGGGTLGATHPFPAYLRIKAEEFRHTKFAHDPLSIVLDLVYRHRPD